MKNIILGIAFVFFSMVTVSAQNYNTAIGLRSGFSNGITVKHFLSHNTAVEGIFSTRWRGINLTGLYEVHVKSFDLDELSWYYGVGGHIGFWDGDHVGWADDNAAYTVIGVDGILGLEYCFNKIPFCVSVDWKPVLNLVGYSGFWGDGGALSIRYTF